MTQPRRGVLTPKRTYSDEAIRGVLVTAYEQGIGYWSRARSIRPAEGDPRRGRHWWDDIVGLAIEEIDEWSGEVLSRHRVNFDMIDRAMVEAALHPFGYMATYGPRDFETDPADSVVADALIQMAVFEGEIRYG